MVVKKKTIQEIIAPPINPFKPVIAPPQEQKATGTQKGETGFQIGNEKVTEEEYNAIKGSLGFRTNAGGQMTERAAQVIAQQPATKEEQIAKQRAEEFAGAISEIGNVKAPEQSPQNSVNVARDVLGVAGLTNPATAVFGVQALANQLVGPNGLTSTGATAGALAGGVLGSVPGFGKAGAIIAGSSISSARQGVKEATTSWSASKSAMSDVIKRLNIDPTYSPDQAVEDFNNLLGVIYKAEADLKASSASLNNFISKSGDEAIKLATWKAYALPNLETQLANAIMAPNPLSAQNSEQSIEVNNEGLLG